MNPTSLRLRRELVERAAEHFMCELVRQRDVGWNDFDVLNALAAREHACFVRPLVLMKKHDRANEREVLHVIAPGARLRIEERQLLGVWIGNEDRLDQALHVLLEAMDFVGFTC